MADVQVENGAIKLAHDLYLSIIQADISMLELKVWFAIAYVTYGANRTKTEISSQDIRFLLGGGEKLVTRRIQESIDSLIARQFLFRQELVNGSQLLGIQKDYDKWVPDKLSAPLQGLNTNISTKDYEVGSDKMSAPRRLLDYAQEKTSVKYSLTTWRSEHKAAIKVYSMALAKTKDPAEAEAVIRDYIDENAWMRSNVKRHFTYMYQWLPKWLAEMPRKPYSVVQDEKALGRRHRWNHKRERWVPTNDRV